MTEFFIVAATAVVAFFFTDPFYGGALTKSTFAKMAVLALVFGSTTLHAAGRAITVPGRFRVAFAEVLRAWWPLLVLSLLIVIGSTYARLADDIKENFLAMGLAMLFLPLMAVALRTSDRLFFFLKALGTVYVVMVLAMLVVLALRLHVFHEEIYVAMPLAGYFLCARPLRAWQVLLGLLLIGLCMLSIKNTTFLLALATLAGCAFVWSLRFGRTRPRLLALTTLYMTTLLLLAALAAAWWWFREELPSGNTEYRMEMYGIAWRHFLDSPLWGMGFTGSSVNYFTLYRVDTPVQNLPTHSDVLDLLAQGGLFAIALWLATLWRILRMGWDAINVLSGSIQVPDLRPWRWLFVLGQIQLAAVITYAVNPPLISPAHGFWIWGGAGVMWALHRRLTQGDIPAPRSARRFAPAVAF